MKQFWQIVKRINNQNDNNQGQKINKVSWFDLQDLLSKFQFRVVYTYAHKDIVEFRQKLRAQVHYAKLRETGLSFVICKLPISIIPNFAI